MDCMNGTNASLISAADPHGEASALAAASPLPPDLESEGPEQAMARRMRTIVGETPLRQIAAMTNFAAETVRRYMNSGRPSVRFLQELCRAKQESADWLLFGKGPRSSQEIHIENLKRATVDELQRELRIRLYFIAQDLGVPVYSPSHVLNMKSAQERDLARRVVNRIELEAGGRAIRKGPESSQESNHAVHTRPVQ